MEFYPCEICKTKYSQLFNVHTYRLKWKANDNLVLKPGVFDYLDPSTKFICKDCVNFIVLIKDRW